MKKLYIFLLSCFLFFTSSLMSFAHTEEELEVMSETAVLIDAASGQVLFEKDARKKMYPASLTKILTGIIAIEKEDFAEVATVSKEAAEEDGSSVYLVEDEEIKWKRLIEGLLINSGNDAGVVIAEHLASTEEDFAKEMNSFAEKEIGVTDSHFTNPHGLFNKDHYTTAYDLAKIAQYAMKNEMFRDIVSTEQLDWKGEEWETTIYNHHQLLRDEERVTGIKTGFVSQSGFTLATSAEQDGMELIAVTLNASSDQQAYDDTKEILNYGFENFSTKKVEDNEVFRDYAGGSYTLTSDKYITVPKEEDVSKHIKNKSLVIEDEEGHTLVKEDEVQATESIEEQVKSSSKSEEEQNNNWLQEIFQLIGQAFS